MIAKAAGILINPDSHNLRPIILIKFDNKEGFRKILYVVKDTHLLYFSFL